MVGRLMFALLSVVMQGGPAALGVTQVPSVPHTMVWTRTGIPPWYH